MLSGLADLDLGLNTVRLVGDAEVVDLCLNKPGSLGPPWLDKLLSTFIPWSLWLELGVVVWHAHFNTVAYTFCCCFIVYLMNSNSCLNWFITT